MPVNIRIEGLDGLNRKLGAMTVRGALKPAMNRSLERLKDGLVKYPPKPPAGGGWVSQMTPKARGYFFAALREGRITVPYKRTMKLGQGWTSKVDETGGKLGLKGTLGNVRLYGPLVQDEEQQAAIHKDRWPTVQRVAKDQEKRIVDDFRDQIHKLVNK